MTKWEYQTMVLPYVNEKHSFSYHRELDHFGGDGWELVSVNTLVLASQNVDLIDEGAGEILFTPGQQVFERFTFKRRKE